jgi:hypothetical protein
MEFKNYAEVLELHTQFTGRFEKRLAELKKELPKSAEALLDTKRTAIKQANEAVKAAEKTRDSLVKRANAEVAYRQETVTRLTREIAELESAGKKAAKAAKAKVPARKPK